MQRRLFILAIALVILRVGAFEAIAQPSFTVPVVKEKPTIDGRLDDPAWETSVRLSDFGQVEPESGTAPTEETEVWIVRTESALYIGAKCLDRDPSAILARDRRRDTTGAGDDRFRIVLDPFGRGREGYFFGVAAGGSIGEGTLRDGNRPAMNWDCIWQAKTSLDDTGWIAEVEIPFRSFGFDRSLDAWGFNVERVIRRREEIVRWASATRDRSLFALESTGEIRGMTGLETGLGLDVRPTVVTRWSDTEENGTDFEIEPSLDAFYRLTPSLTATFTWQTDFAETEVDDRQVNTTRFPLFFPEKRDFFLEDDRYYRFGGIRRSPLPFHSRTIGLSEDGSRVPITAGAKLAGKAGRWNLGLLGIGLDDEGELESDEAYVARVSYDVFKESQIGSIWTHGNPRANGDASTYGLDFHLKDSTFIDNSSKTGELIGWGMVTENESEDDYGWGLTAVYPNSPLWARAGIQRIGEELDPAMGFVRRQGIYETVAFVTYDIYPKNNIWNEIDFDLGASVDADLDWNALSEEYESDVTFAFEGGGYINFGGLHARERFLENFEISEGIVVPEGDYTQNRAFLDFNTASTRKLELGGGVNVGEYLGGHRTRTENGIIWKPSPLWRAGVGVSSNWFDLPGGEFETHVVNGTFQFTPTTNHLFTADIQYDNVSDEIGINARLRWIVRPGSDIYLVFNQTLSRVDPDRRFESTAQEAVGKLGWTIRF